MIAGDNPRWTGAFSSDWSTATLPNPKNWQLITSGSHDRLHRGRHRPLRRQRQQLQPSTISPPAASTPTSATFASGDYTVTASGAVPPASPAPPASSRAAAAGSRLNSANTLQPAARRSAARHAGDQPRQAIGSGALTIAGGATSTTPAVARRRSPPPTRRTGTATSTFNGTNDLEPRHRRRHALRHPHRHRATAAHRHRRRRDRRRRRRHHQDRRRHAGLHRQQHLHRRDQSSAQGELQVAGGTTGTLASDIQTRPRRRRRRHAARHRRHGQRQPRRSSAATAATTPARPATASVTQTGGTINSPAVVHRRLRRHGGATPAFVSGVYNISGGTLNVIGQPMEVANFIATTGTVNMSGTRRQHPKTTTCHPPRRQQQRLRRHRQPGRRHRHVLPRRRRHNRRRHRRALSSAAPAALTSTYTYNLNGGTLTVPQIQRTTANAGHRQLQLQRRHPQGRQDQRHLHVRAHPGQRPQRRRDHRHQRLRRDHHPAAAAQQHRRRRRRRRRPDQERRGHARPGRRLDLHRRHRRQRRHAPAPDIHASVRGR